MVCGLLLSTFREGGSASLQPSPVLQQYVSSACWRCMDVQQFLDV